MQIHFVPGSPNCRKVQAVVAEVGCPAEFVPVDFSTGAHKTPEYLALNPNGLVPTMVEDDFVLWESNAIMQYIADRAGATNLLPSEPEERADVVRWQFWESEHFSRNLGAVLFERIFRPFMGGVPDETRARQGLEAWLPFADILDRQLAARRYVTGDDLTLADYSLGAMLPIVHLADIDLDPYPAIRSWLARLDERPAWRDNATPDPMLEALQIAAKPHREARSA